MDQETQKLKLMNIYQKDNQVGNKQKVQNLSSLEHVLKELQKSMKTPSIVEINYEFNIIIILLTKVVIYKLSYSNIKLEKSVVLELKILIIQYIRQEQQNQICFSIIIKDILSYKEDPYFTKLVEIKANSLQVNETIQFLISNKKLAIFSLINLILSIYLTNIINKFFAYYQNLLTLIRIQKYVKERRNYFQFYSQIFNKKNLLNNQLKTCQMLIIQGFSNEINIDLFYQISIHLCILLRKDNVQVQTPQTSYRSRLQLTQRNEWIELINQKSQQNFQSDQIAITEYRTKVQMDSFFINESKQPYYKEEKKQQIIQKVNQYQPIDDIESWKQVVYQRLHQRIS